MRWNTLSETLAELASALVPPPGTGLVVTEAEVAVPLEVRIATTRSGLVFLAQPGQTRWKTGFLPPTHLTRVSFQLESGDAG